jgi:hypothetical protein
MNTLAANADVLLDSLLIESKTEDSMEKAWLYDEPFDDRYELVNEETFNIR